MHQNSKIPEPIAYLNSRRIPADQLAVAPTDAGFMFGVTLAEQCRTFGGRLFELDQHLDRLLAGLSLLGWSSGVDRDELRRQADEVVAQNFALLPPTADMGLTIFVTPGTAATYRRPDEPSRLTVGVHSYPLPFWLWHRAYQEGQRLMVTQYRQVAPYNWPTALKCRSRMHYYLADQAAARLDPQSKALLLDTTGRVAETSIANVVGWTRDGRLISPPDEVALPGISLRVVQQLAHHLGWPFEQRPVELDELLDCREVLLTSTPYCLLPVVAINGQPIGQGTPGTAYHQLLEQWNHLVGLHITDQAQQHAHP
ncbi:MAG: aminotransferase class IV [Pirellulales bacterium]